MEWKCEKDKKKSEVKKLVLWILKKTKKTKELDFKEVETNLKKIK